MRSKRKGFRSGRVSLKAFSIVMVMAFLVQETVLSVMAELPATALPEDLSTILDDDERTEMYDDEDDISVRMTSAPQITIRTTLGGTTTEDDSQESEVVKQVTEKTTEKSQMTKLMAGEETLTSSKPIVTVSTVVGVVPDEDSVLTTASKVPSSSGAMQGSTKSPQTNKMTDGAIVGQGTTEVMTSGFTLLQDVPTIIPETSTNADPLPTTSGAATSEVITSTLSLSSSSSSSSSSPSSSSPSSSSSSFISTVAPSTTMKVSPISRLTREATTPSGAEDEKCGSFRFQPPFYRDFIQDKDETQETFTRFEMSGRGMFGGDYWNKSSLIDEDDSYVRVDFTNEFVLGELYVVTRSWCNSDGCPEIGNCPALNITKGVQARDIDSVKLNDANTTSASFLVSLRSKAYIPELNVTLTLTNEKQRPEERAVATIRQSVYSTNGSFVLNDLASGARYSLRYSLPSSEEEWNTSEIEFITVPAKPEGVRFHQLNYNTANVTWHQPYYSDKFYISYGRQNSTLETLETNDTYKVLENLRQEFVYSVSVVAQTGNASSVPENVILRLRPSPPVNISIDNTNYSRLEACWLPPATGGYDSFRVKFSSGQRGVLPETVNKTTFCYSQTVQPGTLYTVYVSTISSDLESDPSVGTALSRPSPPVIRDVSKTTTSVNITVSCPSRDSHHGMFSFCEKGESDCPLREFSCSSKEETWTEDRLVPGIQYIFRAFTVQLGNGNMTADSDVVSRRITTYPDPPTDLSVPKISGLEIIIQWNSACFTCNYSIYATPLSRNGQNVTEHSTCYDSVEDDEYRVCRHSLVIPREKSYSITVKSLSWGEESLTGATVHDIIMPNAIKHVTNIRLIPLLPTVLSVNFEPPEVPHEQITMYEIEYHGNRKTGEVCSRRKMSHGSHETLPINVTVKGGCLYEFSIKAFFGSMPGEKAVERVNTTVGAPVTRNSVPSYPVKSTVTHRGFEVVFDPEMFSNENGLVEYFTVIVAEASDGTHNAIVQLNSTLPGWSESIRKNPIPPYQILPKIQVVYGSDENSLGISKRSVVSQPVMVGEESCGGTMETYCNGPLIGGRHYMYWFRGFTSGGFADTLPSQQFLLPKTQSNLIIACLIILMILFLIVIILIALLLRKRVRMDSKGHYQPAPTDSVILKSMSKTSSRAKYIRAVKLTEFCQDFHVMSAHSNFGYSQEFENLRRVGKKLTTYDAVLPENVSKNRYTNILPYDKTRVKLGSIDDELGSDYINASWIPGFSSPREYIACQGPLPGTVDDMWRMIWEKNVSMIVMVTQLVEKGKVKCDQYWPEDHKPVLYGDIQITMTQTTETESWNMREFSLYKPYVDQKKKVKHFNYLSWPDHGVPENSESLLNFIEVVRQQSAKNGSPTVVHCSAGCGRTGTFICLDMLFQQIEEFDYVNVLGTVAEMRSHRQHMVQTEQQYVFIHRCVLDILEEKGIAPKPSSVPMNGNTGGTLLMEAIV